MSYRYLNHQQQRLYNIQQHQRVHSSPDVPFSWEMSPGVSKHHEQGSNRRHSSSEKLQDHLARHRHEEWSGSFEDKELLPYYLAEEDARRAIRKPPLRPPPCLTTSSPLVSSLRSELATRAPHRTPSKFGVKKVSGTDVDPFLAAYMKCTNKQQDAAKRKSAGFGFSCKSSVAGGIIEGVLVRIPRPST